MLLQSKDIETRQDLEKVLSEFYSRLVDNPILKKHFQNINLDHHLPIIINFWETQLLGTRTYSGSPFNVHIKLELQREHFKEWLKQLKLVVHEHFNGPRADLMIKKSEQIAQIFQYKLNLHD